MLLCMDSGFPNMFSVKWQKYEVPETFDVFQSTVNETRKTKMRYTRKQRYKEQQKKIKLPSVDDFILDKLLFLN